MRGRTVALAVALFGLTARAGAQPAPATGESRTAEEFIETARELYSVREPPPAPVVCAAPVGNEIVVCAPRDAPADQGLPSPTERALAAGERPPDPIPAAPYVLGLPECKVEVVCHRIGSAPPPIYIIDLEAIPEALTPEEAALVFRAEDLPPEPNPAEASPAAAP